MSQVKKEGIRTAILEAARQLFTAHGYVGTTLPAIAKAAQVSAPNIYSYFPSKLSILYAIFDPWMREQFAALDQELRAIRLRGQRLRRLLEVLWRELPAIEHGFANNVIQAISTASQEDYRPGLITWMEQEIERWLLDALPEERHAFVRGTDISHLIVMAMDGYIMYRHTVPQRQCSDRTIDSFCRMLRGMADGGGRRERA